MCEQNKIDELLHCPFCGDCQFSFMDMTYMHTDGPKKGKRVKCGTCGAQAPDGAWNHRASMPDGWKLVPVEMTQEQNDACLAVLVGGNEPLAKVYRAMLAAAPCAPAAEPAPLNPSHRALIRLAMNLLNLRNHVPGSDVDLCVKALAELLEGKHSPAPEPSEAWRTVAEIAQAETPAVVNQQGTTADLTSVRCQCCQSEHAAYSYDAGFIAGSGMCQVCDSAMPPKDLPAAVSAGVEEVEVVGYRFFHVDHGYIFRRTHIYEGNPSLEAHSLMTVAQHRRILDALINTPHTDEWFDAVRLEAAHQIQRWGTDHDAGKQPADWFWLLGYLGQKAMTVQIAGDEQKAKHHTISSGAMMLNWFRAMVGDTNAMRPGIAPAQQEQQP
ncbi:hypothetical protein N619_01325 [Ectopseudomonas oleovorans]|nr:hypothetical protein N619_01325 [Pseudomonas oleovorans]